MTHLADPPNYSIVLCHVLIANKPGIPIAHNDLVSADIVIADGDVVKNVYGSCTRRDEQETPYRTPGKPFVAQPQDDPEVPALQNGTKIALWREAVLGAIRAGSSPHHAIVGADAAVRAFKERTR